VIDYPTEYDNSGRVANAAELIEAYAGNAARFREAEGLIVEHALAYGPAERNRLDMFWPSTDEGRAKEVPIVMFIHGGYWRSLDRSSFSHLAYGLLLNNIAVAMPSYTLCPNISIAGIVNEMRRACMLIYQTYNRQLTVVGHSAGGHLAACLMATDWDDINRDLPHDLVTSGMGISGLYDLIPLLHTPINDDLRMDEAQAIAASPIRWVPEASQQFEAWVGGDESSEYHRQSRELAERWSLLGTPTSYVPVPDTNHFTIVDQLTDPYSDMVQRLVEIVARPAVDFDLDRISSPAPDEQKTASIPDEPADAFVSKIDSAVEQLAPEQARKKKPPREAKKTVAREDRKETTPEKPVATRSETKTSKPEAKTAGKTPATKKASRKTATRKPAQKKPTAKAVKQPAKQTKRATTARKRSSASVKKTASAKNKPAKPDTGK